MRIICAKIRNYRNIDGVEVSFHPECNYIIGENNIGKSNFLSLLSTVCNGKSFDDDDFLDPGVPIEVELDVRLLPNEQGFFGDNFSPEDATLLKIHYLQAIEDASPTILCVDSSESLHPKQLRKINFLRYETTSIPSKELRLDTQKGAGLLMSTIIERFNNDDNQTFLDNSLVEKLMGFINSHLDKIRAFRDYSIRATVASNTTDMLTRLFYLSDGTREIESTGSGIQYMAMASLNILCQIMEMYKRKPIPFESLIYSDSDGKKFLPLILAIDEPEVHLHPYLQRSLIGYYKRILSNDDPEFVDLLKSLFCIDGINGQLIIVTHSTDALIGDYRNLIRFCKKGDSTSVVSGFTLQPVIRGNNSGKITTDIEKHLIMHFPDIKEAFFAKCVLLIEGETEYGCIPKFAEKMGISLDDYGICVINARGEESIAPLRRLFEFFHIPSVAVYDGDVKSKHANDSNAFFTSELCFEVEITKELCFCGKADLVREIVHEMDSKADRTLMDKSFVKKLFSKMGIDTSQYSAKKLGEVSVEDITEFFYMYSAWLYSNKGVILGRIIGDLTPAEYIPPCYRNAILKAQEVSVYVNL